METSNVFCTLILDDYLTELKVLRRRRYEDGNVPINNMISLVNSCESVVQVHGGLDVTHAQTLVVAALCATVAEGLEISHDLELGDDETWQKIRDWVRTMWRTSENVA